MLASSIALSSNNHTDPDEPGSTDDGPRERALRQLRRASVQLPEGSTPGRPGVVGGGHSARAD